MHTVCLLLLFCGSAGWRARTAAVYAASFTDSAITEHYSSRRGFYEADPVVRPFVRLPRPAFYAADAGYCVSLNFVALKLSRHHRRLSKVLQYVSIAGNAEGAAVSLASWN